MSESQADMADSATPSPNSESKSEPGRTRVVMAGVVGNLFEWYDFTIYGFFAPAIASEFFKPGDEASNLLKAFGVFAAGYFARPVGAAIFGSIGDRLGRKAALSLSLVVMAVPTLGMVFIPTHASVGVLSPILLILFRLLQGASIGGEFTGAVAYLSEQVGDRRRGLSGALTVSTAMLGILCGAMVFTIMASVVSETDLREWAWRVAFGLGLVILVVAAWLRWSMPQSAQFLKAKENGTLVQHPVRHCLKHHRRELAQGALLISVPAMLCYAVTVFMSDFLHQHGGLSTSQAGWLVTVAVAMSVVTPLFIGAISDRIGRRPFIRIGFVATVVWALPLFAMAASGVGYLIWIGVLLGAIVLGIMQGAYPAALSELFPTNARYTGTSIAYNLSFSILGGTFPLIATWLIDLTDNVLAPGWYMGVLALAATVVIWRIPETGLSPLRET